jgi:hypothetical protein
MTNEELKIKISELLPSATFEEGGEWLNVVIEPNDWKVSRRSFATLPGLILIISSA